MFRLLICKTVPWDLGCLKAWFIQVKDWQAFLLQPYLLMKSCHFPALACNFPWIVRKLGLVCVFFWFLCLLYWIMQAGSCQSETKKQLQHHPLWFQIHSESRTSTRASSALLFWDGKTPILPVPSYQPDVACWALFECLCLVWYMNMMDIYIYYKRDGQLLWDRHVKETYSFGECIGQICWSIWPLS